MGIIYNIRPYDDTILSSAGSFAKKNKLCVLHIGQWYIRWPDAVPKIIFVIYLSMYNEHMLWLHKFWFKGL